MSDGNAILRFYYPLPVFGKKMNRQWPKFREDFNNLAPLVRAAYVDLQPSTAHDPGENDLSGWAIGERDFRNKWRIFHDKAEGMFKIQFNVGTEAIPAWVDAIQIRDTDLRVTITGPGGVAAPTGGFYTDIPRQLAVTQNFPLSSEWQFHHNLDTVPLIWDTFRSNNISIVPSKVDVGDPNIAYFYFNTPVEGKAIAVAGQARGNGINFTDGTNIYYNKLVFNVNDNDFYLSRNLQGNPVLNLQPIDINNFDTSQLIRADGTNPFTGDQSMGGHKLTNVGTPVAAGDAVNKTYADALALDIGTTNISSPFFTNAGKLLFRQEDFYFDTDSTGAPIVNIRGGTSGGGSSGQFGTGIFGADFALSNEWQLNHNLGQSNIVWSVYDDQGLAMIPDRVSVHNVNTSYFYFSPAVAGRAVVAAGPIFQAAGTVTVSETDNTPPAFTSVSTLKFNSSDFYLASDSSGNPVVNFRGTASSGGGGGSGINNVVEDTSPQLGGDLDVNGFYVFAKNGVDLNLLTAGNGGDINITAGGDPLIGSNQFGSSINITTGFSHDDAGSILIQSGNSFYGFGGSVLIFSGNGAGGAGDIELGSQSNVVINAENGIVDLISSSNIIDANSANIQNLADPVLPQDAATKAYVDANIGSGSGSFYLASDPHPSLGGNLHTSGHDILSDTTLIIDVADNIGIFSDTGSINIQSTGIGSNVTLNAPNINSSVSLSALTGGSTIDIVADEEVLVQSIEGIVHIVANDAIIVEGPSYFYGIADMTGHRLSGLPAPIFAFDAANKAYVDSQIVSSPGFYGIYIRESDGNPPTDRDDTIIFDSAAFYINSTSARKPMISLRDDSSGYIKIDGTRAFTGSQSMGSNKLTSVADPTTAQDAATKNYVDTNMPPGFYGVTVKQSNSNVAYKKDTIIFGSDFYVKANSKGFPTVNLRGSTNGISFDDGVSTYPNSVALGLSRTDFYLSRGASGGKPVVNLRQSLEPLSAYLDFGTVGKVALETWAEHQFVVEDISLVCRAGNATAGFYIVTAANPGFRDGTKITGADPITISSTPQRIFPSANRTLNIGDALFLNIYANGSAKGIRVKVRLRRQ